MTSGKATSSRNRRPRPTTSPETRPSPPAAVAGDRARDGVETTTTPPSSTPPSPCCANAGTAVSASTTWPTGRGSPRRTTIYRRWPSKPALVAASVERLYLTHVALPDTGTLRTDLIALLTNSYQLLVLGPGRLFEGLIRESGQRPELLDVVTHTMHARRRFYFQIFNRAIARGEITPETDCGLAIDLLLGPLWVRLLVTGEPIHPDTVQATVDTVLGGILPRTTPPTTPRSRS